MDVSTAQTRRMRGEEDHDMMMMVSKPALAVPDVCRNARHVARNLKEGFEMKQSECSCSGLWRYYVLKNTERACKRRVDSKCYVRKVRVTLDVEKVDVRFPSWSESKIDTDEKEKKSEENEMSFWESALVDIHSHSSK